MREGGKGKWEEEREDKGRMKVGKEGGRREGRRKGGKVT